MSGIGEFKSLSTDFADKFKKASSDNIVTKEELKELEGVENKTSDDEQLLALLKGKTDESQFKVNVKEGNAIGEYSLSMDIDDAQSTTTTKSEPTKHEILPGIITVEDNNSDITDGFQKVDVKAAGLNDEDMNNIKFQGYNRNTEFFSIVKANSIKQTDLPPGTDVKALQNFLTQKLGINNPPIELKDGKFGPQTLEALAKVYNNALKEGDTKSIEDLSTLVNSLASKLQGTKVGDSLIKLAQMGTTLIDTKAKVETDLGKAVEIVSKSKDTTFEAGATQLSNLKNIPEGTQLEFMKKIANNKAEQYIAEDTLSNKDDAEKLLKASSNSDGTSNGVLSEANFTKLKEKIGGKKDDEKPNEVEDKFKITEEEKPHVDKLSSLVSSPVKKGNLTGREHVDALDKNSSPRAQAVESAFRALYHTVKNNDEKWEYSPNKESVGDVLKNKETISHLNSDELKTLVNVYIDKGAKASDLKEVFTSLDPKIAANVLETLKDSDNKTILLSMKPENAAKILDNVSDKRLLDMLNKIGSGDFLNIGDKTKEMGQILSNMSTERVVSVLPKIKSEDSDDILRAMTKEKSTEILKAMDNKDAGKILSNINKDAKSGEFVAEVAKSDPKKAAEILNSMKSQKAEDVFEEVAGSDPKTWGSILAELEKIDPKKPETFFNEIDSYKDNSSKLVKSQVQISKFIYLAEKGEAKEGLKGTEHIDRLRNSDNEKDKELINAFEKFYEGKVKDGVVTWSSKEKVESKTEEKAN